MYSLVLFSSSDTRATQSQYFLLFPSAFTKKNNFRSICHSHVILFFFSPCFWRLLFFLFVFFCSSPLFSCHCLSLHTWSSPLVCKTWWQSIRKGRTERETPIFILFLFFCFLSLPLFAALGMMQDIFPSLSLSTVLEFPVMFVYAAQLPLFCT